MTHLYPHGDLPWDVAFWLAPLVRAAKANTEDADRLLPPRVLAFISEVEELSELFIRYRIQKSGSDSGTSDWLSTKEVALMEGVSDRAVRKRIEKGHLPAEWVGGRLVVHRSNLTRRVS